MIIYLYVLYHNLYLFYIRPYKLDIQLFKQCIYEIYHNRYWFLLYDLKHIYFKLWELFKSKKAS